MPIKPEGSNTPKPELIQHVLPELGLDGVYDGQDTRYFEEKRSGNMTPVSRFLRTGEICRVQTLALSWLENEKAIYKSLADLPQTTIDEILENEYDPIHYLLHAVAQSHLHVPISPAVVRVVGDMKDLSPKSLQEITQSAADLLIHATGQKQSTQSWSSSKPNILNTEKPHPGITDNGEE